MKYFAVDNRNYSPMITVKHYFYISLLFHFRLSRGMHLILIKEDKLCFLILKAFYLCLQ